MMRPALSALALSVLAGACLAACSANFKPNTVTFPGSQPQMTSAQAAPMSSNAAPAASSTPAPTAATATSVANTPESAASAPAATGVSSAATVVSAPAAAPINMPTRGMLMSTVAREFGEPEQKLPPVPDPGTKVHPPITRWVYPQYVVYFEYNYVVHSVLKAHPFSHSNAGTH